MENSNYKGLRQSGWISLGERRHFRARLVLYGCRCHWLFFIWHSTVVLIFNQKYYAYFWSNKMLRLCSFQLYFLVSQSKPTKWDVAIFKVAFLPKGLWCKLHGFWISRSSIIWIVVHGKYCCFQILLLYFVCTVVTELLICYFFPFLFYNGDH